MPASGPTAAALKHEVAAANVTGGSVSIYDLFMQVYQGSKGLQDLEQQAARLVEDMETLFNADDLWAMEWDFGNQSLAWDPKATDRTKADWIRGEKRTNAAALGAGWDSGGSADGAGGDSGSAQDGGDFSPISSIIGAGGGPKAIARSLFDATPIGWAYNLANSIFGGDPAPLPDLLRYLLPQAQDFERTVDAAGTHAGSYDQFGNARADDSPADPQQPRFVNGVQVATTYQQPYPPQPSEPPPDPRRYLNDAGLIADAVRHALLYDHPLGDVINDL